MKLESETAETGELPETKLCQCGRQCPVVDVSSFLDVDIPEGLGIGIAECKACDVSHYVAVGDHDRIMEFYQIMFGDSLKL